MAIYIKKTIWAATGIIARTVSFTFKGDYLKISFCINKIMKKEFSICLLDADKEINQRIRTYAILICEHFGVSYADENRVVADIRKMIRDYS